MAIALDQVARLQCFRFKLERVGWQLVVNIAMKFCRSSTLPRITRRRATAKRTSIDLAVAETLQVVVCAAADSASADHRTDNRHHRRSALRGHATRRGAVQYGHSGSSRGFSSRMDHRTVDPGLLSTAAGATMGG
jgi:hypothetical protein